MRLGTLPLFFSLTRPISTHVPAGHLSVHIPDAHPEEVHFLFEWRPQRFGYSLIAALGLQVIFVTILAVFSHTTVSSAIEEKSLPFKLLSEQVIWLSEPGPGGGGGGGGNKMSELLRKAKLLGKDKVSISVEKLPQVKIAKKDGLEDKSKPVDGITIPILTLGSVSEMLVGGVDVKSELDTLSRGSGTSGGVGTGTGTGIGSGVGSGFGSGTGGGTGGGVYHPGNDVTSPIVLNQVKPQYTLEAMQVRIQGIVRVECIVRPNGLCSDIRVVQSLDSDLGLDREAVKATQQWRFKPGMRLGQPVPVLIMIEFSFILR